jgi:hypothetical protein
MGKSIARRKGDRKQTFEDLVGVLILMLEGPLTEAELDRLVRSRIEAAATWGTIPMAGGLTPGEGSD